MFVVALALGIAFAAYGGERFVRGAVGLSIALRIPAGIIGATIAAFATSAPELAVSVFAAVEDDSAIALGNAVGSDLANLGLVLGIAAVMVPVVARWGDLRRDLPGIRSPRRSGERAIRRPRDRLACAGSRPDPPGR